MKRFLIIAIRRISDIVMIPITILCSLWIKFVVRKTMATMPVSKSIFLFFGFMPVRDHYYQPLINPKKHLKLPLDAERVLPGIDLNVPSQLDLLSKFHYAKELKGFPLTEGQPLDYYYNNVSFASGDSEYLYSMVRYFKPKRMIEIGSGHSTKMAINATKQNQRDDSSYICEHICIEPYEMPWLEKTGVKVVRKKVEDVELSLFKTLSAGDILFIDSSHIIRPQSDVLTEYLEILPILNPGVVIHVHDIFTPRDYLKEWLFKQDLLWNEQYLLEAFLCFNKDFKIIGALNYLKHHYFSELSEKLPILATQPNREPGSFWIQKV